MKAIERFGNPNVRLQRSFTIVRQLFTYCTRRRERGVLLTKDSEEHEIALDLAVRFSFEDYAT